MDNQLLHDLQSTELVILREIERVCAVLNISFFLDAGTALGAVRHGGFIPWDDDLDVGMVRSDYEIFVSKGQDVISDDFFIQTPESDPTSYTLFAKVRLEGSVMRQRNARQIEHEGVWVDIFPYDAVPENSLRRKFVIYEGVFFRQLHYGKCNWSRVQDGKFLHKMLVPILNFVPESWLRQRVEKARRRSIGSGSRKYFPFDYNPPILLDYEDIFPLKRIPFEDGEYPVPNKVEKFLVQQYGDWTQLPPEDERHPKHNAEIVLREDVLRGTSC